MCTLGRSHLTYRPVFLWFWEFPGPYPASFKTFGLIWDARRRWFSSFDQNNISRDQCTVFHLPLLILLLFKKPWKQYPPLSAKMEQHLRYLSQNSMVICARTHAYFFLFSKTFYQIQSWLHFFFFFKARRRENATEQIGPVVALAKAAQLEFKRHGPRRVSLNFT